MGVSGFLISCARRRATSPHAASRCACRSAVMSSNTITKPMSASSPGSAVEVELLAPLLAPGGKAHRERGDELAEPLVAGGKLRQGTPGRGREVGAENRPRGFVRGTYRHGAVDGEHAGRQARQDDGEPLALALHRLLTVGRLG